MKKVTAIVIGAGARGITYATMGTQHCPEFELVAYADPDPVRQNAFRERFPNAVCYNYYQEILAQPKMADVAIICTQDRLHLDPALKAIDLGYHLLLEKPVACTAQECLQIADAANAKGVQVLVCHVLRFTPYFRTIKKLLDEGKVGKIMNMDHLEPIGNVHYSHSYVRGDWQNSDMSTPLLLAKSCHDLDMLYWLSGEHCTRVQSFGSLSYFTKANKPEGAPEYCVQGCPVEKNCPYSSKTVYQEIKFGRRTSTKKPNPTDEDVLECITNSRYGKCVFQSDNNVCDHQTVNLEYESGATATLTVSAFSPGGRKTRITGTKGELYGEMRNDYVTVYDFETRETTEYKIKDAVLDETIDGGHGGGDEAIIMDLIKVLNGEYHGNTIATIDETVMESHLVGFAAEESRANGTVVDMKEYYERIRSTM